jgi:hypothetical protein
MTVSGPDDVARFAALLRELKERTDRGYGSLARRLGMNTSTLHRYCAGEAVPVDFAPVERFAALCGASGEERLELHRRWLAASAARRRPRTAGAARAATGPDAGPASEVHPGSGSGSDSGSNSTSDTDTGSASPRSGPSDEAVVVGGPVGEGAAGRPWYRRRGRVAIALAAGCALLATVGSLSVLPDGRRSGADGAPTAVPSASATTSSTAPRGRAASPAPSGTATPRERPAASLGPRRESPSRATASGTPKEPAPAAPPLAWTVDSQKWAYGCGHDYVIAGPPGQVPPPPAPQDAGTWAGTQAAVHGGETTVELSVQGTSDTAVVLTALRVRVAGRGDPAPGNAYAMDQGCGGALTPRYFAVDLDRERPLARAVAGNDAGTPIPAVRMPYRVSATDPEVLLVTARTGSCDCRWYLELDWSSQGRAGTVRVDDHGRPFRTSGIEGLPRYTYDTSARRWTPRTD